MIRTATITVVALLWSSPAVAQNGFPTEQQSQQQPQQQGYGQQQAQPQGQLMPGQPQIYPNQQPYGGQPGYPGQQMPNQGYQGGGPSFPQQGSGQYGQGGMGGDPSQVLSMMGPMLDQLAQQERQDHGVRASSSLHTGQFHGPTPSSIPGGQVITTKGVVELVTKQSTPYVLVDVLGGPTMLPGAMPAAFASQPGSFNDGTQQQFAGMLQQATQGRRDMPIILYCQSTQCWMSYNAALRAINAGYPNVLWYRGGVEAWQSLGLPTMGPGQNSGRGASPQMGQMPQGQSPYGGGQRPMNSPY